MKKFTIDTQMGLESTNVAFEQRADEVGYPLHEAFCTQQQTLFPISLCFCYVYVHEKTRTNEEPREIAPRSTLEGWIALTMA